MIEKLILGTVQLGLPYGINNASGQPSREAAVGILDAAHEAGIRTLDTAEGYGEAPEVIGQFHRGADRFRVNSKFSLEGGDLRGRLRQSLQVLGVPSLACYSFHRFADLARSEAHRTLRALREEGLVEAIGVSIYTDEEFSRAIAHPLVEVIQLPFNLLDNWSLRGPWIERAKEQGKEIHVRSVFLQGLFFREPALLPPKLQPLAPSLAQISAACRQFGQDVATLALNYPLHLPLIDRVLVGVERLEQLEANLRSLRGRFDPAWLEEIGRIRVAEKELLNPSCWR